MEIIDCHSVMFFAANVTVTGADVLQPSKYASGLRYLVLQTVQDMALEVSCGVKGHVLLAEYASETWRTSCTENEAIATPLSTGRSKCW